MVAGSNFQSVGSLDKLSYAVLLAGLVYAVLSDVFEYTWNTILQGEVQREFASDRRPS